MIYSYEQFIMLIEWLQDTARWDKRVEKKWQRSLLSADEDDKFRY
jgi:hypothetical protein